MMLAIGQRCAGKSVGMMDIDALIDLALRACMDVRCAVECGPAERGGDMEIRRIIVGGRKATRIYRVLEGKSWSPWVIDDFACNGRLLEFPCDAGGRGAAGMKACLNAIRKAVWDVEAHA